MSDNVVSLTKQELQKIVEEAAQKGASNALRIVGLHDDEAAKDLTELRTLLDAWRDVKKGAFQTFGKIMTTAILAALAAGGWFYAIKPQ